LIEAEGALPKDLLVNLDRAQDMLSFHPRRNMGVVDPTTTMSGDLMIGFGHRFRRLAITFKCHANRERGEMNATFPEQPHDAPESCPAAVLEERFDDQIASAQQGLGWGFRKVVLRVTVAMQDVVLPAFLEVDNEVHGDARVPGPLCMRGRVSVAKEVSRIFIHPFCSLLSTSRDRYAMKHTGAIVPADMISMDIAPRALA